MFTYHKEHGFGKIEGIDIEENQAVIDFTDYPYEKKKVLSVELSTLTSSENRFKEIVHAYGQDFHQFRVVPIVMYWDRTNDGEYIAYEEMAAVPKEIADQVFYGIGNFTMDSIRLFDNRNSQLLETAGSGYADLVPPKAFLMKDFGKPA